MYTHKHIHTSSELPNPESPTVTRTSSFLFASCLHPHKAGKKQDSKHRLNQSFSERLIQPTPAVQRHLRRRDGEPKGTNSDGKRLTFASEQRPTGVQSFIVFLMPLPHVIERFLGHRLKGKAHTQSKEKHSKGSPGGGGNWNKARPR